MFLSELMNHLQVLKHSLLMEILKQEKEKAYKSQIIDINSFSWYFQEESIVESNLSDESNDYIKVPDIGVSNKVKVKNHRLAFSFSQKNKKLLTFNCKSIFPLPGYQEGSYFGLTQTTSTVKLIHAYDNKIKPIDIYTNVQPDFCIYIPTVIDSEDYLLCIDNSDLIFYPLAGFIIEKSIHLGNFIQNILSLNKRSKLDLKQYNITNSSHDFPTSRSTVTHRERGNSFFMNHDESNRLSFEDISHPSLDIKKSFSSSEKVKFNFSSNTKLITHARFIPRYKSRDKDIVMIIFRDDLMKVSFVAFVSISQEKVIEMFEIFGFVNIFDCQYSTNEEFDIVYNTYQNKSKVVFQKLGKETLTYKTMDTSSFNQSISSLRITDSGLLLISILKGSIGEIQSYVLPQFKLIRSIEVPILQDFLTSFRNHFSGEELFLFKDVDNCINICNMNSFEIIGKLQIDPKGFVWNIEVAKIEKTNKLQMLIKYHHKEINCSYVNIYDQD